MSTLVSLTDTAPEPAPARDLSRFSPSVQQLFGEYVGDCNINIGCGLSGQERGFINIDRVDAPGVDSVVNLEQVHRSKTLGPPNSTDCVLASHVLEHIRNLIPLMREIHRVLKPGGYLCAVTPYASSDDADEDPTHVRRFTEKSWMYFDRRLYERPGHCGHYPSEVDFCFDVVKVSLVPYPDMEKAASDAARRQGVFNALDIWKRTQRNVIKEMIAVLRKVIPHEYVLGEGEELI